jgi:hypothetical protein
VNLRHPRTRVRDAQTLHEIYGLRSSMFIVDRFRDWARGNRRKLMILVSYDVPSVMRYLKTGERFDADFVDYLDRNKIPYVDYLKLAAAEYEPFKLSIETFIERFYIERAGAQVFGHYNPYGNFWFAFGLRPALVERLDPKPPAYR